MHVMPHPPSARTTGGRALSQADDVLLVERLRLGDEAAFEEIVRRYGSGLLRVAGLYTPSRAVAEEVVQETWLGVVKGIDHFEGRSSLKTWLFRIVSNRARTRGTQERRSVPFATLAGPEIASEASAIDADRFGADGLWASPPRRWEENPERSLESGETVAIIESAIAALPEVQRCVITMRDLGGWPADEVRATLDISESNHRVLLHRARSKVRLALDEYFDDDAPTRAA